MARKIVDPINSSLPDGVERLTRLWLLRLLVPLGGHRGFIGTHSFNNDTLAEAVGLADWLDTGRSEFDDKQVRAALRAEHTRAEKRRANCFAPRTLAENLVRLASLVGLTDTDCRILEFSVLLHNDRLLDDTADFLGHLSSAKVMHALAVILDLPLPEVNAAMSSQGLLSRSGLVSLDRSGTSTLRCKIDLLSGSFADRMLADAQDPVILLRDTVSLSEPPELSVADFGYAEESLTILRPYLKLAVETKRKGVNILLYGDPGTGKSQLARILARDAGCELFEVASEDADGDPVAGERRLRAFRAAQSFFAQRRALILFDETEDVFNDGDGSLGRRSTAQKRKAWMNRALEENPVPALWLSNAAACLDPAFVRRFDVVMELPVPPKRDRERIIAASCGDLVDSAALARLAAAETLAPAVIARAATVAHAIRNLVPVKSVARAVEHLVEGTLIAQGHAPLRRADSAALPDNYDPRLVNADANLEAITEGLARSRSGRICMYGPPGTGKSAFGRWVAERLAAPLHAKRVSDIVSPYVGATERNLARAFREADIAGAVLMLDEVDSFLQDRRAAHRSWEVTEVNELLTQMESFSGVFIATTNLMEGLDQAALRRFDLKLRFGFLDAEQSRRLFRSQCEALQLGEPSQKDLGAIAGIDMLTPGDFAAIARQHRFRHLATPAEMLDALVRECALKQGGIKKAIGFH